MFFHKILDDTMYELLFETYNKEYLLSFNKTNFLEIYKLLRKYNFYYINDIILYYLEIFELDKEVVEKKIKELEKLYGKDFVYTIGKDISKLEFFLP